MQTKTKMRFLNNTTGDTLALNLSLLFMYNVQQEVVAKINKTE